MSGSARCLHFNAKTLSWVRMASGDFVVTKRCTACGKTFVLFDDERDDEDEEDG